MQFVKNIIFFFFLALFACQQKEQKNAFYENKNTQITVNQDTIIAKEDLYISIANLNQIENTYLLLQNSFTNALIPLNDKKGTFDLTLDSTHTSKSGILNIQIIQNQRIINSKKITIVADTAYKYIETYLGPRGVIVASGQPVMTVAIPTDAADNPVNEGTTLQYHYLRPNGTQQKVATKVQHLIAFDEITPQQKVGKTLLGITCDKANSNEKEFSEEPDWANAIEIQNIDYQSFADGRQFFKVKTLPIKDQFQNLIADGTAVTFYGIDKAKKVSTYESLSLNGVAEALVQNPDYSGEYQIFATCGEVKSALKIIFFQRCIQDFQVKYDATKGEITAGQIVSNLQQYIPDGTPVEFNFYIDNQQVMSAERESVKGFAVLKLSDISLKRGTYQVSAKAQEAQSNSIWVIVN